MVESSLFTITVRELTRNAAEILARTACGERFIVCRYGHPVATLQPLEGVVVQPLSGRELDLKGSPLGAAENEVGKLSEVQPELLRHAVRFDVLKPSRLKGYGVSEVARATEDLQTRCLVKRCDRGLVLTGRGMILREWLLAARQAKASG
jgi:antitoxin (DNA-binding transcriptional repressor) of toxin-antitoxin stability system